MANGIDANMENMIQMYLKYGTKNSLSVDEFMLFRKQAVSERIEGVDRGDEHTGSLMQYTPAESSQQHPEIPEMVIKQPVQNFQTSQNPASAISPLTEPALQRLSDEDHVSEESIQISNDNAEFTDAEFLKIMREIQD